ncbi:hypothetical protein QJS10_CPB22g00834 [Acorus calamus]|uniref:Uncharacterized protein n=1 Tax=Acorus calamus TaxID=4465 RepID=A0AAV9C1J9_ACOCL|nr:hypothetical protein QJS10_CPB22g00834 [Acorus calamus]
MVVAMQPSMSIENGARKGQLESRASLSSFAKVRPNDNDGPFCMAGEGEVLCAEKCKAIGYPQWILALKDSGLVEEIYNYMPDISRMNIHISRYKLLKSDTQEETAYLAH